MSSGFSAVFAGFPLGSMLGGTVTKEGVRARNVLRSEGPSLRFPVVSTPSLRNLRLPSAQVAGRVR